MSDTLRNYIETLALQRGTFILSSGITTNTFFDMKRVMLLPDAMSLIVDLIGDVESIYNIKSIGGVTMGGVPLACVVGFVRKLPTFLIRKETKNHGTCNGIEGYMEHGSRVLLLEDVTTTGQSALNAAMVIRDHGGIIDTVLTVVDRAGGAKERLNYYGINLISLFNKDDFK